MKQTLTGMLLLFLLSGCAGMVDLFGQMGDDRSYLYEEEDEFAQQAPEYDDFDPYHNRLGGTSDQVSSRSGAIRRPGSAKVETAIVANDVVLGMTKQQVVNSWGEPTYIEYAGDSQHGNERWIYGPRYQLDSERVIIFEQGKVAGWYR